MSDKIALKTIKVIIIINIIPMTMMITTVLMKMIMIRVIIMILMIARMMKIIIIFREIIPVPLRRVRTIRSLTHSHPFQASLPNPPT